jgi:hypothetical protein
MDKLKRIKIWNCMSVGGLITSAAALLLLILLLINQVQHPPIYADPLILAKPYEICVRDGDVLSYTVRVIYDDVSPDKPAIGVFYKNLFYEGRLVGVVSNNIDYVVRSSPSDLTLLTEVDLGNNLVQPWDWPDGDYVFRDAVVNVGPGDGSSSYDVLFENRCN